MPLDPTTLSDIVDLQGQAKDQQSQWLIEGACERPVSIATFQSRLVRVAATCPFAEPLTTHRLRPCSETALMNGGGAQVVVTDPAQLLQDVIRWLANEP